VIVEDEQLSLAIGKRGQNVRLASELIGARIDIKSESDVKDEVADALAKMLQTAMCPAPSRRASGSAAVRRVHRPRRRPPEPMTERGRRPDHPRAPTPGALSPPSGTEMAK
jgi:hypothetical protein